ncbi:MAG: c-type cytochrome [Bacteriovoracaceae bacterium]
MNKLVVFIVVVSFFVALKGLNSYKSIEVSNEPFVYSKAKAAHKEHLKALAEIEEAKKPKVEKEQKVKKVEFKVALDTPELKRGFKLYSKCIVCHGKLGSGKKSQNAPKIGGQFDWYVALQISNMQKGIRVNKAMEPYIKKLSSQDIADLSAYISKLPWKPL